MVNIWGSLEGIGLPALVRFVGDLGLSGVLRATLGPWAGEVAFDRGRAVAAVFGGEHGRAALETIGLVLRGGEFTFASAPLPGPPAGEPLDLTAGALAAHLEGLLSRSGCHDGLGRLAPAAVPRIACPPDEDPTLLLYLTRGAVETLLAVDGRRTVAAIVAECGRIEALRDLAMLTELGLTEIAGPEGGPQPAETVDAAAVPAPSPPAPIPSPEAPGAARTALPPEPAPSAGRAPSAGPGACPRLGFADDQAEHYLRPTRLHRCFAGGIPERIAIEDQRAICLTVRFASCARFLATTPAVGPVVDSLRPGGTEGAAGGGTRSAPPSPPGPAIRTPVEAPVGAEALPRPHPGLPPAPGAGHGERASGRR